MSEVSFIVQGRPADDWPGHDRPGRSWGMGSRVRYLGAEWIVIGARSVPRWGDTPDERGGWIVQLRDDRGAMASVSEYQIDAENA